MVRRASAERAISPFVERCFDQLAVQRQALILDMPCGFGRHAIWLAAKGFCVIAMDIDPKRTAATALLRPREIRPGSVDCLVADAEADLPYRESIFDVALVVHYYSDGIVEKMSRYLKPGGHLVFETFGAQGQNWRSLPISGATERVLNRGFEVIYLKELLAGPSKLNAVVRALARKK